MDAPEYVLTVYTRDQKDTRWSRDNEGNVALRTISRLVWQHYAPEEEWRPPPGSEDLLPDG